MVSYRKIGTDPHMDADSLTENMTEEEEIARDTREGLPRQLPCMLSFFHENCKMSIY